MDKIIDDKRDTLKKIEKESVYKAILKIDEAMKKLNQQVYNTLSSDKILKKIKDSIEDELEDMIKIQKESSETLIKKLYKTKNIIENYNNDNFLINNNSTYREKQVIKSNDKWNNLQNALSK